MTQNVVALYDDLATAQKAVTGLVDAGFTRDHISLVANDAAGDFQKYTDGTATTLDPNAGEHAGPVGGSLFGALVGAVVGLGAILIPGIGPVIAAGPLIGAAGAIAGAVIGGTTGGITGGLLGLGVPQEHASTYAEGIRRGGTLVTVTADDDKVSSAQHIVESYNPVDVEHRAATWRQNGWTGFDENAAPLTPTDIHQDRSSYANPVSTAVDHAVSDATTTADLVGAAIATGVSGVATGRARIYNRSTGDTINTDTSSNP